MTTPEITRRFEIDMGHRLLKHESKCRNTHGHRYVIEVSCLADDLDEVGRVIDFGAVKSIVGQWLDDIFDHGFAAQVGDPIIPFLEANSQKYVVMEDPPTVENLVKVWYEGAAELLEPHNITVTKVRAYETPNCWADWTLEDAEEDDEQVRTLSEMHGGSDTERPPDFAINEVSACKNLREVLELFVTKGCDYLEEAQRAVRVFRDHVPLLKEIDPAQLDERVAKVWSLMGKPKGDDPCTDCGALWKHHVVGNTGSTTLNHILQGLRVAGMNVQVLRVGAPPPPPAAARDPKKEN